jgi:hypothetical protein
MGEVMADVIVVRSETEKAATPKQCQGCGGTGGQMYQVRSELYGKMVWVRAECNRECGQGRKGRE